MNLRSKMFYGYALFVIIYGLLTLLPAPAQTSLAKYHIGATGFRLLEAALLIFFATMWFAVTYSYTKLHAYSKIIKDNPDGKQMRYLSGGLLALAVGFPIISITSSVLHLIARHDAGFLTASTIISNYLHVLYPLVAYLLINQAARGLSEQTKARPGFGLLNVVVLIVIVLGVIFCDLIARSHHSIQMTYHMSYGLVMLTIGIPYMYLWFLGLIASAEMYIYSKEVAGVVYRRGLNRLMLGLGAVIIIDILLQYVQTFSAWFNSISPDTRLLLLFVLLLSLSGGFIMAALGTKELMKIEEA